MPSNAPPATASTPAPTVVVAQPRDPGTYCGTDDVDVEDWLAMYESVSKPKRWDATLMLANVIFYLAGTARIWFGTHEEELNSWDTCKQKLRHLFGKPIGRKLGAKKDLASRAQSSTESYISYIQDVLALCRKVDSAMSETDNVGHILKGIADVAFNLLLCKDCTTVDSVLRVCRQFEQAEHRRIAPRFDCLPNTPATSSCKDLRTLQEPSHPANLTRILRRELEAMTPIAFTPHPPDATIALIQAVVRQEFANAGLNSGQPSSSYFYVPMFPVPPVPDGAYVTYPVKDVVLQRNVILPHTVLTVIVSALTAEPQSGLPNSRSATSLPDLISAMFAADLPPDHASALSTLLGSYSDVLSAKLPS
ncbi:uncharacterized protein LOC144109649 [Amblyomma americanum]